MAGIGARLWDRLWDLPRTKGLHPFQEIQGARHRAPSTPGDLLLHLRAKNMDVCCELASMVMDRLRGHAEVVDETHGYKSSTSAICSATSTAPRTRRGRRARTG